MCNKLGCLSQGWGKHAGNGIIEFIFHIYKPNYRREDCNIAVCKIRPQKTETRRMGPTLRGNIIYYPGEVSTPTSDLNTMKIHVKRSISDVKSRYMCMDVKYFYLNNQMDRSEYIMI